MKHCFAVSMGVLSLLLLMVPSTGAEAKKPYSDILVRIIGTSVNPHGVRIIDAVQEGDKKRQFTFGCNSNEVGCTAPKVHSAYRISNPEIRPFGLPVRIYKCDEYTLWEESGTDIIAVCLNNVR